jgi:uncharacterized protein YndB with AHSA1/START domain
MPSNKCFFYLWIMAATPDNEIITTRTVNASRELAYKAWTDPQHLSNWWGPAGFTNTFHEHDLRVGGQWRFTMHGPDKGHYENHCEFEILESPSVIAWKRHSKPLFRIHTTFEEVAPGKTKITFRMIFDTPEESNKLRPFVVDKNEENFDRLEAELVKMA